MTPNRTLGYSLAAMIFLIDQISKYIVTVMLDLPAIGQIELLSIFNLTWVENYGVSMGLLTASGAVGRWLLVALTLAISGGVAVWLWREKSRPDVVGLGLVLGGALGNIVDRVRFGYVADFLDLHFGDFRPFLVFNVADAAITCGVVILLFRAFFVREKPKVVENA